MKALISFILRLQEKNMVQHQQLLSEIIQTIFSILVYKSKKVNLEDILKLVTDLSKKNIKQINGQIEKNLDIFYLYFSKGKDVEKVFFSYKKILLSNPRVLLKGIQELIKVNIETKNKLLLVESLKLIKKCLKGKPFKNL